MRHDGNVFFNIVSRFIYPALEQGLGHFYRYRITKVWKQIFCIPSIPKSWSITSYGQHIIHRFHTNYHKSSHTLQNDKMCKIYSVNLLAKLNLKVYGINQSLMVWKEMVKTADVKCNVPGKNMEKRKYVVLKVSVCLSLSLSICVFHSILSLHWIW